MPRCTLLLSGVIATLLCTDRLLAADCTQTSTGLIPLNDLGSALYLGKFQGGLYPDGLNTPPIDHADAGIARAAAVKPLAPDGQFNLNGWSVLLSIGMSNTTQEFCSQNSAPPCNPWTFTGQANADPEVNHASLTIINGAAGGQSATTWDSSTDLNYNRVRDTRLAPQNLSEAQVQAVWIKLANPQPQDFLPAANADAYVLLGQLGNVVRAVRTRYPNVRVVFLSSRIYAGYASTPLNPEPYAYESAFAVKWLIEAQINQVSGGEIDPIAGDLNYGPNGPAPWLAWGPYLWADGLTPRSDGFIWQCADFQKDGTHPAQSGEEKVGTLLLAFMKSSQFASPWFLANLPGDLNDNGVVDADDLLYVINHWGPCPQFPPGIGCAADVFPHNGGDGVVNVDDLLMVINHWSA